jgi:hypothetical protein
MGKPPKRRLPQKQKQPAVTRRRNAANSHAKKKAIGNTETTNVPTPPALTALAGSDDAGQLNSATPVGLFASAEAGRLTAAVTASVGIVEPITPPGTTIVADFGVPSESVAEIVLHDTVYVTDHLDVSVIPFKLPDEWEAQRQEVIRQHALLLQAIHDARAELAFADELRLFDASRAGIGHNQPPETIEIPSAGEVVDHAAVAADAVVTELTVEQPHLSSIRAGTVLLRRVLTDLEVIGRWLAHKGDLFVDEFVKELGKRSAQVITIAAVVKALGGIAAIATVIVGLISGLFVLLGHASW